MDGDCVVCNDRVDTASYGWFRQVIGWQETGKHGAGTVFDKITTGQIMHRACMVRKKHHPGQGEMFT